MRSFVKEEKLRFGILCNMAFIIAMSTIYITPYLEFTVSPAIPLFVVGLWIIDSSFRSLFNSKFFSIPFCKGWLLVFLCQFLAGLLGHSSLILNNYLGRIPIFIVPIIAMVVLNNYNHKEQRLLATSIVLIYTINLVQNIMLGIISPEIFKYSEIETMGEDVFRLTNAGGTLFVCITMFLMGIFYMIFDNAKNYNVRMSFAILAILCGYYLVAVNTRGTTFFVGIFMLICLIVFKRLKFHSIGVKFLMLISFSFIIYSFAEPFLLFVRDIIPVEELQVRIDIVMDLLHGKKSSSGESNSLTGRIDLALLSLDTFTSSLGNFLWGVGEHEYENGAVEKTGVGHHSQLIDCFAYFGIIGGILYYNAYYKTYKFISHLTFTPKLQEQCVIIVFTMFVYSYLNNFINRATFIVMFMLFPIVITLLTSNNKKENI